MRILANDLRRRFLLMSEGNKETHVAYIKCVGTEEELRFLISDVSKKCVIG